MNGFDAEPSCQLAGLLIKKYEVLSFPSITYHFMLNTPFCTFTGGRPDGPAIRPTNSNVPVILPMLLLKDVTFTVPLPELVQ